MAERERSDIETFMLSLPDPQSARVFLERLGAQHPDQADACRRDSLLLSRLLTIAAFSPFLAENLLRHPDDIDWFARETRRDLAGVKTTEQLSEDLSRMVTRMFDADARTQLARFKNRELLRIYLRDCLHIVTLAEVTEEVTNLADVILGHALKLALQEVTNRHGAPQVKDERGRIHRAEFAVVSLGKLGCRELNYASDIDLMFLYAGGGETAGDGRSQASVIDNKVFFTRVAQQVITTIGGGAVEGGVYRVDLRLRPYGRDGDLVWEVGGAARYYHEKAQNWERQMLIRSRASAGSEAVFATFFEAVRDAVFNIKPRAEAFADVRRAKEKIDRKIARNALQTGSGFNVKLGRGGIREIEFIAQALQLAHGGREPWVRSGGRSAQTLIVLARLAEKGYLSEPDRTALSAAYTFYRVVEHRLQMEHGAQTHTLPVAENRLELLARRCGYQSALAPESAPSGSAAAAFLRDVEGHSERVRAIYRRVFDTAPSAPGENPRQVDAGGPVETRSDETGSERREAIIGSHEPGHLFDDESERLLRHAAVALARLMAARQVTCPPGANEDATSTAERCLAVALTAVINPVRSLKNFVSWVESFSTYGGDDAGPVLQLMNDDMTAFVARLLAVLSSQHLSAILIPAPLLASSLVDAEELRHTEYFTRALSAFVNEAEGPAEKADALRRAWYRMIVGIGYHDIAVVGSRRSVVGRDQESSSGITDYRLLTTDYHSLWRSNQEQTALAEASLRLAADIALEAVGVKEPLPFAIMGLGRLGHAGMDYGSDLDLLVVFDDAVEWAGLQGRVEGLQKYATAQEYYARFTAELSRVLSSITRAGFVYRVDLRLRPEGKNGQLAQGLQSLGAYLRERASAWEHSAYLKVREIAGDLAVGKRARKEICAAVFAATSENASLRDNLRAMRLRLEREKAKGSHRDIKWGAGGMTDVYFITRYLQLRDHVTYPTERGTLALIQHLGEIGSLDAEASRQLYDGYLFLRRLDHWMRLLLDRPTSHLPASQTALVDIVRSLELDSLDAFEREYKHHTTTIRTIFTKVV